MVGLGVLSGKIALFIDKYFLYPDGLYGLLAIIGLIIIYLVRPKPIQKVIPSLMFFLKQDKKTFASSFFRVFTRNTLFFIQLLGFILLAISAALPYLSEKYSLAVENNVIVIDVSASSQAKYDGSTRFDKSVEIAKDSLGKRNTIVLASDIPELKAADVTKEQAKDILSNLKPKDTTSNIAEAISFAGEQLLTNEGRILVISDFIYTGADPIITKRLLESRGLIVDFVDVSSQARNIGIVELSATETNSVLSVKNFNEEKAAFDVKVGSETHKMEILPNSVEALQFVTPPGTTEIELKVDDDFEVDNKAYVQNIGKKTIDALMITNADKSNLQLALQSSPRVKLDITNPPLISKLNHEVYIVKDVNAKIFLKETVNDLLDEVNKGASLVIAYQPDIFDIEWGELMPVRFNGINNDGAQVNLDLVNQFTKDIYFGRLPSYAKASPKEGATVIASTADNSTIIAYMTVGRGKVIYYGIDDKRADFKASTSYPIFWNNILKFLVGRESIVSLNFKTGSIIEQQHYDKIGKYDLKTKSIAVNLLSEDESNINKKILDMEGVKKKSDSALFQSERPREFDHYFLIAAMLVIFFELIFIKIRGDI